MRYFALRIFMLLAPICARAQCTYGLIGNCPAASGLQVTDVLAGFQYGKPNNQSTVKISISALLGGGFPATFSTLNTTGMITAPISTTAGAGFSLTCGDIPASPTNGNLWCTTGGLYVQINGATVGPLGGGGGMPGTGTVNSGTTGQLAWYAASGTAVSGTPSANIQGPALTLGTSGLGASLTMFGQTSGSVMLIPSAVSATSVLTLPVGTDTLVSLSGSQTLSNKAISGASNNLTSIANASLTNSTMTFGGQSVALGASATVQGNGAKVQLGTGTLTAGHCLQADSNANVVDAGGACTTGGGGGTVTAASTNQMAWYASNGTVVTGLASLASGVLVTSAGSVPSISRTLPSGLSIPSPSLVTPALGTPSSGNLSNETGLPLTSGVTGILPVANGGTGVATSTGTTAVVLSTSPTLVTPTLGVALATSINGLHLTSSTGTLTIANGATLATSGAFSTTFTSTGATALTLPTSGTVTALGNTSTGSGSIVLATSPTLVTPALGTPSAAVLTNATGLPLTSGVTGVLGGTNGGSGVNNGSTMFSRAGNVVFSGAFSTTFTVTGNTAVTLPISGTLATVSGQSSAIAAALPSATSSQIYVGTGAAGAAAVASSLPAAAAPTQTFPATVGWGSNTAVIADTVEIIPKWTRQTGSVVSVTYQTGGTGTPSFNIAVQENGVNVAGCNALTVNGTQATATCSTNTITLGQPLTLITSGISGTPFSAYVQLTLSMSGS